MYSVLPTNILRQTMHVLLLVGKGSEVVANLEKLNIPIKYFDKYANPVEKPEFSKPIPAGVTALSVMNSYVEAVGGKEALERC